MILKIQKYGGQMMLSLPQSYVHVYGIKPGDLFELKKTARGFEYRMIPKKEIVSREFGSGKYPRQGKEGEGGDKL